MPDHSRVGDLAPAARLCRCSGFETGANPICRSHRLSNTCTVSAPFFWVHGLATEGSLAALEFGFCELHLDTVATFAVEANTSSRRVMEKAGMSTAAISITRRFQN